MERIARRDEKDGDLDNSAMYDDGYNKMINFLDDKDFNYVIIDTENKTNEKVIEECLKKINENENKYVRIRKR